MDDFPDDFFPDAATLRMPSGSRDLHGGIPPATGAATTLRCYVERQTAAASRDETHGSPEAQAQWLVFTPADPQAPLDSVIEFAAMRLRVVAKARLSGVAWRTDCVQVS